MKKFILISILLSTSVFSEENIFDQIGRYSSPSMGKISINNNSSLKASSEHVKELPEPWTVAHLISLYDDPKYLSYRKDILIMLIASGDDRGREFFGSYVQRLNNDNSSTEFKFSGEVLNYACIYYIENYSGGGTEQAASAVTAWWKGYKEAKQDLARERWQIAWENTENKDKLSVESVKAISKQVAGTDLEKTEKTIADLKAQGAVNSLMVLLDYPSDPVVKAAAESLSEFPTKEVATALFRSLKNFDTALAGGTNGTAVQDEAILAVTTVLFKIAKIEPSPDFADREKRNGVIEKAIDEMPALN